MKFNLFYTTLFLLAIYHLIFCKDWTHSKRDNDEENEKSRERPETQNFQIGIFLPWVKTSRQHLSTIPKSFLVQINLEMSDNPDTDTLFFCKVEVTKRIKIIGLVRRAKHPMFLHKNTKPSFLKTLLKFF